MSNASIGPTYAKCLETVFQSEFVQKSAKYHIENLILWNNRLKDFKIVENVFDNLERLDIS